ncbi:hypothetical protein [Phaffia rhodozyma]|uniref:Uncharacterized protein n=1 Tax=Phaffia rhodozyma TaxID=264483 RepID=A0A0F7SUU5_PHARH|nr:hypothetical protein [Phaffia rhodozyma]
MDRSDESSTRRKKKNAEGKARTGDRVDITGTDSRTTTRTVERMGHDGEIRSGRSKRAGGGKEQEGKRKGKENITNGPDQHTFSLEATPFLPTVTSVSCLSMRLTASSQVEAEQPFSIISTWKKGDDGKKRRDGEQETLIATGSYLSLMCF